ncbi:DUF317 domain-containing protein [Streptomyces sp. P38-E01]|uniref:DUF317 domain-containing protein n=1 Tax=Streptomyces tardus TaxID=2780544 RepID=A0A949N2F4_9ACTN|nr:DUF317 domain-containing protein [Streptomyces tardus]MBU7598880.1 DUF317 domain-containing protein [Streptomyces tardus]
MTRQQWQGWGPGEQPEQHYLISPRSLAGGGDIRHVRDYLLASGWADRTRRAGPLHLVSPDRTLQVGYDAHVLPGGWTVHSAAHGHQPEWVAVFGRQTPVEIVAGLTDALALPRSALAPDVWVPLMKQGWQLSTTVGSTTATSRSGARVQFLHRAGEEAMWWADARGWRASFTSATPLHLIAGFATAMADPEPVLRPLGHAPHGPSITATPVSVLPSQLGAWRQTRIAAARANAWARNSPTPKTSSPAPAQNKPQRTGR